MGVSFTEAANRHAKDAELLDSSSRTSNANHLWGMAAECALKAVLRALAGPALFMADGTPKPPYRQHIDHLWPEVITFFSGRSEVYLTSLLPATNPFNAWSVRGRYAADADVPNSVMHREHQHGAAQCLLLLETARSYGHRE